MLDAFFALIPLEVREQGLNQLEADTRQTIERILALQVALKEYSADNFLDEIMTYWKKILHTMIPKPENARKSDYSSHAQWMAALHELSPEHYESLLAHWRTKHRRRCNLWRDLRAEELG